MRSWNIHNGDALETLKGMESESFDAVFCDPPYGLSFMGKAWDHGVPSVEVWTEALRVLKPGAFLMAFGGTRTFHRLTVAIEDAGFEIRDCAMWLYGSGFPKSHDISKGIDKAAGAEREVIAPNRWDGRRKESSGPSMGDDCYGEYGIPSGETAPATDAAKTWNGYGTALKPAFEPCIIAMKPLDGTFANNALKHGVAGLHIEAGRVEAQGRPHIVSKSESSLNAFGNGLNGSKYEGTFDQGRWPSNLILDPESAASIGEQSRFFYCAKASRKEREEGTDGNTHPCLKPLDLNRYLSSLILPPKRDTPRRVLVPFSGSGSEMIGALLAGWDEAVGIEREAEYVAIAQARLAHHIKDEPVGLFEEAV